MPPSPPTTTMTTHRLHLPDSLAAATATAESESHAPRPHQQPKSNTKLLSIFLRAVIMTSITSIFFLLMGLASLILIPLLLSSLHRHHHHHHHRHNRNNIHIRRIPSKGIAPNRLKKLPQFNFSKQSETLNLGNDCAICLDGFKQGQSCRELIGCGHVLHRNCVDTWLLKVGACPLCRTPVRFEDDDKNKIGASFDGTRSDSDSTSWGF